jgi:hypothetical protein
MIFGNRLLREVTQQDILALVNAGMREHLQLEYKSASYEQNDNGRREFLQDVCMFANSAGGVLLVGVTELRGDDGQPSGAPDPDAELGVASPNPEAALLAYDARVVACIQDRLPVESHAVRIENGRFVLVFRIPNSIRKPHCVRFQGHVYFPSRRDRNRYEMDLREIKEQTMRAASQLDRAEDLLGRELNSHVPVGYPLLLLAQIPIFNRGIPLDITDDNVRREIEVFDVFATDHPAERRAPTYGFAGLQRTAAGYDVTLHRNGMLTLKAEFPGGQLPEGRNWWQFELARIDVLIRGFAARAKQFYLASKLDSPSLLGAQILTSMHLRAEWNFGRSHAEVAPNENRRFIFPVIEIGGPSDDIDRAIRPICDHIHQTFGLAQSNWFRADGTWHDPR